jgi:hypothetical protein
MTDKGDSSLEAYIRANRGLYTEAALRSQALAAGHSPDAVDAALAATRDLQQPVNVGRVVRRVFLIYLAVYLILDALIFINPANRDSGFLGDLRGIGILILSLALGGGFVASLVWIASRRGFFFVIGCGLVLYGISLLTGYQPTLFVALVVVGLGMALALAALRYRRTSAARSGVSVELLMLMPLLILLAVGGACVVSGLPIPRPA